jgi:hypothetical protein
LGGALGIFGIFAGIRVAASTLELEEGGNKMAHITLWDFKKR